jgi:hypothetical protein
MKATVAKFTDDPTVKRAIVLGTFQDRLKGYANLTTEPELWQPFGFAASGMDPRRATNAGFSWGHDALIDTLIKFGYIPLSVALIGGFYLLFRLLRYMYSLSNRSIQFKTTRLCLALNAGILVGAMSSGAQFRNFPQNFYFVLWIAIPFATYQQAMLARKNAAKAVSSADSLPASYPALAHASRVGMSTHS